MGFFLARVGELFLYNLLELLSLFLRLLLGHVELLNRLLIDIDFKLLLLSVFFLAHFIEVSIV